MSPAGGAREVFFSVDCNIRLEGSSYTIPSASSCEQGPREFSLGGYRGGAGVRMSALPSYVPKQQSVFDIAEASAPQPERGFRVRKIQGDGRCMFRAMVRGMAANQGLYLNAKEEVEDADELRLAVSDALCRTPKRRGLFQEAVDSIEHAEGGLQKYCGMLQKPGFWGGEVEILVLSRMLQVPIFVYQSAEERGSTEWGYYPIVKYGEAFQKPHQGKPGRKPVHLLYTGGNHYDLLLA
eukprot:jgi/Botrbrau1/18928/Bobra.177_2s0080.1